MSEQKHPSFPTPADPNVAIWRYQDFTKFVSMLEHRALFFYRVDLLDDPFEGSYSRVNERLLQALQEKTGIPARTFRTLREFYRWVRQWTVVNCWHVNEQESAAMWRLYAKSDGAVAIRRGSVTQDSRPGLRSGVAPRLKIWNALVHKPPVVPGAGCLARLVGL